MNLGRVREFLYRDELWRIKVGISVIFLLYFFIRWWTVRGDMLKGISPVSGLGWEVSVFVFLVVFPQLLILILGLTSISLLQLLWKFLIPKARDSVTRIGHPEHSEKIETVRNRELPFIELGGLTTATIFFIWLLVNPSNSDIVTGMLTGFSLVGVFLVLSAREEISDLKKSNLPDSYIQKKIKRDGAASLTRIVSLFAVLVLSSFILDALLGIYYAQVLKNSIQVFSDQSLQVLSSQRFSPESIINYYGFYSSTATFEISLSFFQSLLPLGLILALIPFTLKNLYFRDLRDLSKIVATYAIFILTGLTIDAVFGEGAPQFSSIGASSILPAAASTVADNMISWLKEQLGYIDCTSCGEQVSEEGMYCEFCGSEKR